jgi:hypothetical protein
MGWLQRLLGTSVEPRFGVTPVDEARRIADAEQDEGSTPDGCAWLDEQTVDDLDLPLVFRTIDRTSTATGAQALWRWLVAPAVEQRVLVDREAKLELLRDAGLRDRVTRAQPEIPGVDAEFLPRLLWEPSHMPAASPNAVIVLVGLLACLALSPFAPIFVVGAALLVVAAFLLDMKAQRDLAEQAHALVVLAQGLDGAARLAYSADLPPLLLGSMRADLEIRGRLQKRLNLLAISDPFGILEWLRAMFLVRLFAIRSCMRIVNAERERLRRIIRWTGELDALAAIARLRTERPELRVPTFGGETIEARELVHPALAAPIANDLDLRIGLLITGSNASGQSTFLRAVGVNAVLAQSIHTTFATWRGPLVRVRTAMRINDDLGSGTSTYMAEVALVGALVNQAGMPSQLPTLALLDEPFHGTNPAVRVPIVVAVLEFLASHGLVMCATHDLDVARQVGDRFDRGYFTDVDGADFDRKLRPGVAPSTNALALLEKAGYPAAILERISLASPVASLPTADPRND